MNQITQIHRSKQPRRPHFIQDWAIHRGFKKAVDLANALDVDKSLVSRWFNGSTPDEKHQERLAALLHCDRQALFRHPDDDWMSRFFKDRTEEEVQRIKTMLEAAFPFKRTGTDG